ncbi:MAG: hypothetical protein ABR562_06880 [Thermoplasmatota archaeon]
MAENTGQTQNKQGRFDRDSRKTGDTGGREGGNKSDGSERKEMGGGNRYDYPSKEIGKEGEKDNQNRESSARSREDRDTGSRGTDSD